MTALKGVRPTDLVLRGGRWAQHSPSARSLSGRLRFPAPSAVCEGNSRKGENEIGKRLIGAAIEVHKALGPGLLESAYEACLDHELRKAGLVTKRQLALPLVYDGVEVSAGYRIDMLVDDKVVVELKTVDAITDLHVAQLLSYLKLGGFRLGYVLNFNVKRMTDGMRRLANDL